MSKLQKAIVMAIEAHDGQVDKGGEPYIFHPLRVMMKMQTEEERIVAVLHDTLEDTSLSPQEITKEFGMGVMLAVDALTRKKGETYSKYIRRVKTHSLAKKVKIADIHDNLSPSRIQALPVEERGIVDRYLKALSILNS